MSSPSHSRRLFDPPGEQPGGPIADEPPQPDGPLNLLLVEDDPDYARIVHDLLQIHRPRPRVTHVHDLQSALQRLGAERYDAVLLDLKLPDSQGLDTLQRLQPCAPGSAFVVLTGTEDDEVALAAVREGAQDYLVKSELATGRLLRRFVRHAVERKRIDEALHERDLFVRLIVDNVGDLISITDRHGRRQFNSRSYRAVIGEPEALRGSDAFAEIHPDDRERIREAFQRTVATGEGQRAEFRFVRADGSIRYMQSEGTAIKDASGQVDRVVVVSRDITERKEKEEALRQSERRVRQLLDSATDYIYTVTLSNGRPTATEHGPGCEAVLGYTPKDYAADDHLWYKMVLEADQAAVLDQASRAQAGIGSVLEHRLLHKDGSVRWVRNTTVPRSDNAGRLVAYDGLVSDITARKRAEERQAVQYAVARALADSGSLGEAIPGILRVICEQLEWDFGAFWVVDDTAGVLRCEQICNRLGSAAAGFEASTRTAVFGQGFGFPGRIWKNGQADWMPDLAGVAGCARVALAHNSGLHAAFGFPILLRGRVLGIEEFFSRQMRRPDPQMVEAFAAMGSQIGQFIERRQAEERLQQTCTELAASQMQLIRAARLELVGGLTTSVAHDVKNPLANIRRNLELLQDLQPDAPAEVRAKLDAIWEEMERAKVILDDLLDLSRRSQLTLSDNDLNTVIEHSLGSVGFQLAKARVKVLRELDKFLAPVPLDRVRMQEVFINLFTNAIEAMPTGGSLTVRTYRRRVTAGDPQPGKGLGPAWHQGDTVAVTEIDDTGCGIPEPDLPGIFELVHKSSKSDGTGLGLWIVKTLVELHGGLVRIHNRPEGGVRATLTLSMERRKQA